MRAEKNKIMMVETPRLKKGSWQKGMMAHNGPEYWISLLLSYQALCHQINLDCGCAIQVPFCVI
jgi:hypothetical protein